MAVIDFRFHISKWLHQLTTIMYSFNLKEQMPFIIHILTSDTLKLKSLKRNLVKAIKATKNHTEEIEAIKLYGLKTMRVTKRR